jgi:hypothetical protein
MRQFAIPEKIRSVLQTLGYAEYIHLTGPLPKTIHMHTENYTSRWVRDTESGKRCLALSIELVDDIGPDRVEADLAGFTERLYSHLPSGDYGRGDVKRVLVTTIASLRAGRAE